MSRSELSAHQAADYQAAFHDWLAASRSDDWGVTQGAADKPSSGTSSLEAGKAAPPIAEPMYLSAYANIVTHNPAGAVKSLTRLVGFDPALPHYRNALALALMAADPGNHKTAFEHARMAVALAPQVPQFAVTYVFTDRDQWKIEANGTARLTRTAALWLQVAGDELVHMPGNARRLGRLLESLEETGDDPAFPFVLEDYEELRRKPSLALTRPLNEEYALAQKAIVEWITTTKAVLADQEKAAREEARQRQAEIERVVEAFVSLLTTRAEAKAQALVNLIESEGNAANSSKNAARAAREELALATEAEEDTRGELVELLLIQELASQVAKLSRRIAHSADDDANVTDEDKQARHKQHEEAKARVIEKLRLVAPPTSILAAVEAYDRGDFVGAQREARAAADRGDTEARHMLGFLFSRGEGVPRDMSTAYVLLTAAGRQNDEAAINDLVDLAGDMNPVELAAAHALTAGQQPTTPD